MRCIMSDMMRSISYDLKSISDGTIREALDEPSSRPARRDGNHSYKAEVNSTSGLVLLQDAGQGYIPALHLRTPSQGSWEPSVQAAADILEMFGFADQEQLQNSLADDKRRFSK